MIVVVGGHSRNIGKTSLVCGIIKALRGRRWTAIKLTQFGSGVCGSGGEPCDCATTPEHPFEITEQTEADASDSGRYLAAGAERSYWVRTAVNGLGNAIPAIRAIIAESENVILESNSILQYIRPDKYLAILDFSKEDFKPSSLRYLDRADGFVVIDSGINVPLWQGVATSLWAKKPQFFVHPPRYASKEVTAFVAAAPTRAR